MEKLIHFNINIHEQVLAGIHLLYTDPESKNSINPTPFTKLLLASPSLSTIPTIEYQFWLLTIVEESQHAVKKYLGDKHISV